MRHLLVGFFVLLTAVPAFAEPGDDQLELEAQAVLSQELKPNIAEGAGLIAPAKSESSVEAAPAVVKADIKTKESEIPLFTKEKVSAAKIESPFGRIMVSLAIIVVIGLGMMIAAKKYGWKKNQEVAKTQIKVLTQHHLGPKKSLAIIRVAGESILIGITDQNINLIKPLALLDEEIAEMNPQQGFEASMDEFTDAQEDEFSFGNVQDRVSLRMKDLRKM